MTKMSVSSLFLIFGALTLSLDSVVGECNWPQVAGPDGLCYAGGDGECSTESECMPESGLTCIRGKCKCLNPQNMWYDSQTNSCGLQMGLSCTPDHPTEKCVKELNCLPDDSSTTKTGYSCQCSPDKLPGLDGYGCFSKHMDSCSQWDCGSTMLTYGGRGLTCRQGQCQCENEPDQVWDDDRKLCVGVEGTSCFILNPTVNQCQSGLYCAKRTGSQDGVCQTITPSP